MHTESTTRGGEARSACLFYLLQSKIVQILLTHFLTESFGIHLDFWPPGEEFLLASGLCTGTYSYFRYVFAARKRSDATKPMLADEPSVFRALSYVNVRSAFHPPREALDRVHVRFY
jgi:hypothetical protein